MNSWNDTMKGVKQSFRFKGSFVDFVRQVQALKAPGGSFAYYPDGTGFFVEPDLTESMAINLERPEVIYKP